MKRLWQFLRGRILLANLLVLAMSAGIVLLLTRFVFVQLIDDAIRPNLVTLSQSLGDPGLIYAVEQQTLATFRNTVFLSVAISSLITLIVSIVVSLLVWRTIVQPLRQMEQSSQRIAAGQYRERIPPPNSQELVAVVSAFNQMAASLEDTERQRITLINNVTHELRTPLTSLRGYLEALADGYFTLDAETIGEMEQEIGRLSRLVDSVHTLSRIETGSTPLAIQPIDLMLILQRTLSQQQPRAHSKQLELIAPTAPMRVNVLVDEDALIQILVNLLTNAIRYTPEGGAIEVLVSAETNQAIIQIQDNGIGIAADVLPHIFQRFYRADPSRSPEGTGVGLTIARELAWAMNGDLNANSGGLGRGSCFTLTLPLAENKR
ncbi:MAG: sensor histidine kinase [Candidatus Promineifilaceae bacterium]